MTGLPRILKQVGVPPIKCQGIKTKLVPFIFGNIHWEETPKACWIEPFMGSGVVALNLTPNRAILADTNEAIIRFYRAIQSGELTSGIARDYLTAEGKRLEAGGEEHYYFIRERFNQHGFPLDFLFLNRSCFNGLMRFNRRGEFNVPFCRKNRRFTPAYITKIVNQINWVAKQMRGRDWLIELFPYDETLRQAAPDDFVYLDPPYIGRHTDYYNAWNEAEAVRLAQLTQELPCGFALSMWLENQYRRNGHLEEHWSGLERRVFEHFYHVGSTEDLRNPMLECLLIKPGFAAPALKTNEKHFQRETQLALLELSG
jgi:DNA adenine methylase